MLGKLTRLPFLQRLPPGGITEIARRQQKTTCCNFFAYDRASGERTARRIEGYGVNLTCRLKVELDCLVSAVVLLLYWHDGEQGHDRRRRLAGVAKI